MNSFEPAVYSRGGRAATLGISITTQVLPRVFSDELSGKNHFTQVSE